MIFNKLFKKDKSSESRKSTVQSPKTDYYADGMSQYEAGHYDKAIDCFQKAITEHPDNENAYLKLADTYNALDKHKEAKSALYKLLALNPDCALAYEMLRLIHESKKDGENKGREEVSFSIDEVYNKISDKSSLTNVSSNPLNVENPSSNKKIESQSEQATIKEPYDPHLDFNDYSMPNIDLLEDDDDNLNSLKSIIKSQEFAETTATLPVVLGMNDNGSPYIADLTEMPHLLISGQTGFGKTTLLNVMLTSLLFKKHPADIKFVIIGDKRLDLSHWDYLRNHFLTAIPDNPRPVIIDDTKTAVRTLNALCIEMDSRYDLLKAARVRNIKDYNNNFCQRRLNPEYGHRYLPYIVVAIYEFAGYMSSGGKEIELPLCRLSYLAKAVGIHLVISSNRSDTDVFTTQLKNNFPARISFKVARGIESNAILGFNGAQNLRFSGEMLFSTLGFAPKHIQGAYLSDDDIDRVIDFIGGQHGCLNGGYMLPEYLDEYDVPNKDFDANAKDEFFNDAARLVVASQFGSTSLLQRKLQLGYNRAGRLIDQLEAAGIVGPYNGSKFRDVYIKDEEILEKLLRRL
ncbi:MAG: tetratricopeptide repeat protein [Bacteroidales bacterium]|nr:tetratricopeptide repeat protein [Bacteroidales bacterium]